jgi:hypothetical protein
MHQNIARRAIRDRKNESAFDDGCRWHTFAISTQNGERMFQGDHVGQKSNFMCGTYGGTMITLCLVQYIRYRGWEQIVEILHMMHRVDYNIRRCNKDVDERDVKPFIF